MVVFLVQLHWRSSLAAFEKRDDEALLGLIAVVLEHIEIDSFGIA